MKEDHRIDERVWTASAVAISAALVLSGCAGADRGEEAAPEVASTAAANQDGADQQEPSASENPLAGTRWRLSEIQSMDDAVGTTRPDDPSAFTMTLNADGTVSMRLDCNRANGTWTIEPSADVTNGRFEFGPLASTEALCPPPRLDEQIAAQARYIRGYLIRDGRLYLSLMADGGIWAWEPADEEAGNEIPFSTDADSSLEAAILEASPDYTREVVRIGDRTARYVHARIDLNGDGRDEVFAYLLGSIFCGSGGCSLLLFQESDGGYALVNNFPISRLPVIVSDGTTGGWRDLIRPESGGGAPASHVRHAFDGTRYVEQERVPADTEPEGTRVLAGEVSYQIGIPLEPRGEEETAEEAAEEAGTDDPEVILRTGLLGEWQWVGFEGLDNSTLRVEDPSRYTLFFRVDGVTVQADCNRGQGSYDLDGSSITFSPFAITRMACPEDSMADRYLSQLEHVRSWRIDDGRLFLTLMADGGIMDFRPGRGPA
jgi:heat shock protein HslJ